MSRLSKPGGLGRFLNMLFSLFMIFGLCAAVPTPIDELEARGQDQSSLTDVTLTRMGDTNFRALTKKGDKFGSYGFDSCLGVLIIGNAGAILGHYGATDTDINDHQWGINPKRAAVTIPTLFTANRASLTPVKAYVYAQVDDNKAYVFPQLVAELVTIVHTATGLAPEVKTYKKSKSSTSKHGGSFLVEVKSKPPHSVSWGS